MKLKATLLSLLTVLTVLVGCSKDEDMKAPSLTIDKTEIVFESEAGEQTLSLTSTRYWEISTDVDWLNITPKSGKASDKAVEIKIAALENNGKEREAKLTFNGVDVKELIVKQKGNLNTIYSNNLDKELATEDKHWPWADKFQGWHNQEGSGAEGVEYASKGVTIGNFYAAVSDGKYSTIKETASGKNYISFDSANSFVEIKNIKLAEARSYSLVYATNRFVKENKEDTNYGTTDFLVYVSNDGNKWVQVDYKFDTPFKGNWGIAHCDFTMPQGADKLFVYFKAVKGRWFSLDDIRIDESSEQGKVLDFSKGIELSDASQGGDKPSTGEVSGSVVYYNNFDKAESKKNGKFWPFIDQFDGWKNETGSGIANIKYLSTKGVSPRSGHGSDGNSQYAGSGMNKIFFSSQENMIFGVGNIKLNESSNYQISFGVNRFYFEQQDAVIDKEQLQLFVSEDGQKWVELKYDFTEPVSAGIWSLAVTKFSVPAGVKTLSMCVKVNVKSQYSIDDLKLESISEKGTAVDFSKGVALEGIDSQVKPGEGGSDTDKPSTDNPTTASGKFASNIAWTQVELAEEYFANINGGTELYSGVKLGTGKKPGKIELTIPAGTKKMSFYAVAWSKKPTVLQVVVADNVVKSFDIKANDAVKGLVGQKATDPCKLQLADENYTEVDLTSFFGGNALPSETKIIVQTSGSNTRAVLFGINSEK